MKRIHPPLAASLLVGIALTVSAAPAAPEYGLKFDGIDDHVETSAAVIPTSGNFTVEFWALCPAAPSSYREIISQGGAGNACYIGTDQSNNIRLGDSWGTVSPAVPFPAGAWHHFALVRDAGSAAFYIDGMLKASRAGAMANPAASTGLRFGRQYGGYGEYWPGSIADVRVWNRALGAAELQQPLTGGEANLVAWWQFRETAGTTCVPGGTTGAVGTLANGPLWFLPPALGTTALTVSQAVASHSVTLAAGDAWTAGVAGASESWLHLAATSGTGGGNVAFTCDANTGTMRSGTLTIAGLHMTVTQAGAGHAPVATAVGLAATGLLAPRGVAIDATGNVYIADSGNNAVRKWNVSDNTVSVVVETGLSAPRGVAVDAAGNVYIADTYNHAIRKWNAASDTVTTLVAAGLDYPTGVAVDRGGNVYIADSDNHEVKKWNVANGSVRTLVSSGLGAVGGVAVDFAGNVYIADTGNSALKKWNVSNNTVSTLVAAGLNMPRGVAVDGTGTVYIADTENNVVKKWDPVTTAVTTLVSSGLNKPYGVGTDAAGNVCIGDSGNHAVKELPRAFVSGLDKVLNPVAGTDSLTVVPAAHALASLMAPTCDQPWLALTGFAGGAQGLSFADNPGPGSRTAHVTFFGQGFTVTQAVASLADTARLLGPRPGPCGVSLVLDPPGAPWSAAANADWLHLLSSGGNGSADVVFTCDNNTGATRTGTLTIAGKTLTITQAGTGYVAAPVSRSTLVTAGPTAVPNGVAVDPVGNVAFSEVTYGDGTTPNTYAVKQWQAATGTVATLIASGLDGADGVAVDLAGNVYVADSGNAAVKKWTKATNTVSTLVSSGLARPKGVAVDGNLIYIADAGDNAVKKWNAGINWLDTMASNLSYPQGVAVAPSGLYMSNTIDPSHWNVKKWWGGAFIRLFETPPTSAVGLAVDGTGNVYFSGSGSSAVDIRRWDRATNTTSIVAGCGINNAYYIGVALDAAENLYFADKGNGGITKLTQGFVDCSPKAMSAAGGNGTLPPVLPVDLDLQGSLGPTSDQAWLTITGVGNGVVSFTCAPNPGSTYRMATITLLGKPVPVVQAGPEAPAVPRLETTRLLLGPGTATSAVELSGVLSSSSWTASANDPWLHPTTAAGSGPGRVVFSCDANTGDTRVGTLTIAGMTCTVTQAGSSFQAVADPVCTLLAIGTSAPKGAAVDAAGNLYFSDTGNNAVKRWNAADHSVTTLVDSGLSSPAGIAVDDAGNVYFADTGNHAIKKWTASDNTVTTLIATGLSSPCGVALDRAGNLYIADTGNHAIKKWSAADNTVTTLAAPGLNFASPRVWTEPRYLAVDGFGNVYFSITDEGNRRFETQYDILKWDVTTNSVSTLATSTAQTDGVAVDGSGNVYFSAPGNWSGAGIKRWNALDQSISTVTGDGLAGASGLAASGAGDLYLTDIANGALRVLPVAFVDRTPKVVDFPAGTAVLPSVLSNIFPPGGAVSGDQSWLTGTGMTDGVAGFTHAANPGKFNRTAVITVMGVPVPIWQGCIPALGTCQLWEGPGACTDSVVLNTCYPARVTTDSSWLHPLPAGEAGDTIVRFACDANPGPARSGTLTISGQVLTVTQAGANYIAAPAPAATLANASGPDYSPAGVAVDAAGNLLITEIEASWDLGRLRRWNRSSNAVTTLLSEGVASPMAVALDAAGDAYIANYTFGTLSKWHAATNTMTVMVAEGAGLYLPTGVAVDAAGEVLIADPGTGWIKRWTPAGGALADVLASDTEGVAVDVAGNLCFGHYGGVARRNLLTGAITTFPTDQGHGGLAADGSGNVFYINGHVIVKWTAATNTASTVNAGALAWPNAMAVDATGNLYIADTYNGAVKQLARAWVDPTPRVVGAGAGGGTLPAVFPASQNLGGPFTPTSDQPWLTITGVDNGIVSYAVTATAVARTAHIELLGRSIAVTQDPAFVPAANPVAVTGTTTVVDPGTAAMALKMSVRCDLPNATLGVLSSTDLSLPAAEWEVLAVAPVITGAGCFEFTVPVNAADPRRFYRIRLVAP